ncbi:MAG: FibroRumin family radical SAM-modified Cys-rich RiPP [Spirochaetaceae bacterium]|nr:FibroRumin family radical SAM-modified Cys-rich RiPP [Spirochaetaceae bacterium]
MSASTDQYAVLFGNVTNNIVAMPRCACVSCNSCTCACSCRAIPTIDVEWEDF